MSDQEEIERLREKVADLKRHIKHKDDVLHQKNLELDALGRVWCSGGCEEGVLRYDDDLQLTEQQVRIVERNTIRLRDWLEARKCRDVRENKTPRELCEGCVSRSHCFGREE